MKYLILILLTGVVLTEIWFGFQVYKVYLFTNFTNSLFFYHEDYQQPRVIFFSDDYDCVKQHGFEGSYFDRIFYPTPTWLGIRIKENDGKPLKTADQDVWICSQKYW